MSDGSRKQPMQARLSATFEGAPPSSAAGGTAAASLAASLSAFSAISASRTSLVAAPRSGCCCRSLASSGLKPRSGSATRSPRTASRRASGVQGSHMRGAPGARVAAGPAAVPRAALSLRGSMKTCRASPSLRGGRRNEIATWECLKTVDPWRATTRSPRSVRASVGARGCRHHRPLAHSLARLLAVARLVLEVSEFGDALAVEDRCTLYQTKGVPYKTAARRTQKGLRWNGTYTGTTPTTAVVVCPRHRNRSALLWTPPWRRA